MKQGARRQNIRSELRSWRPSLDRRLTLVSAPAGFGKTTLISTWARQARLPVTWLSLDETDNDPTRFLSYLVAALQQIDAKIGQDVRGMFEASPAPRTDAVVGALANDLLTCPIDFVLVLDDFHVIHENCIHEAIQSLVAHQPPRLHLLIATREDPQLPLARMRASGELGEVRAQELRFTPQEEAAFLSDVMGLALEPQDIDALDSHVEGWIAGLQLAALSMQNRENPAELIAALAGSHHFILGYLTEEVLRQQTPEVRSFLLETSVLTRLTGPLCDAVTGRANGDTMLRQLYTANAFVVAIDEAHAWYRYHHLFADLLRSELRRTQPQLVPTLHVRASEWYEAEGSAADAIEHALAAQDYPRAVRLLEVHARPVTLQGYAQTVESWLRRLPREWRVGGPRANLAFGWSLLLRGQLGQIEAYARDAEAAATERSRAGAHEEAAAIIAEACALRATVLSVLGDTERGYVLAREAVARAPHDDIYLQGMVRFTLASVHIYAGDVVQAIEVYQEALPLCQAAGNTAAALLTLANLMLLHVIRGQPQAAADLCRPILAAAEQSPGARSPALATVYGNYAEVLYEWNELPDSRRLAEQALALGKRGGHVAAVAYGHLLLSRLLLAEGDLPGAESTLAQALQTLSLGVPDWVGPRLTAQQVVLALAGGDETAASRVLRESGVRLDDPVSERRELLHIAYLRLLLHQGRRAPHAPYLDQALDLADRLRALAEQTGRTGRVLEVLVLRALLHQAHGDAKRALSDLGRALSLAEPEGYLRLFVDEGAPIERLLRAALVRGVQSIYVARLLAAFPDRPGATSPQRDLVEPLTEREIDVLRLIARGLSYEEVAQQLVISLNTVRFHVKAVYGKLGVDRRAAAIDRARVLKIL
ncbi:MAG: LuxR C-terminal-related transcriptional regulator [Chloroflexota bacterium]